MDFGFTSVAGITVICYLFAQVAKAVGLKKKWIPVICGVFGGFLGFLAIFLMPEFPAKDFISGTAIGIVSGLAATGANQVYKQIGKEC